MSKKVNSQNQDPMNLFGYKQDLLFVQNDSKLLCRVNQEEEYDLTAMKSELIKHLKQLQKRNTQQQQQLILKQLAQSEFANVKFEDLKIEDDRLQKISDQLELLIKLSDQQNFELSTANPFTFEQYLNTEFTAKKMIVLANCKYNSEDNSIVNEEKLNQVLKCFQLLRNNQFTKIHIQNLEFCIQWQQIRYGQLQGSQLTSKLYEIDLSKIKVDNLLVKSSCDYLAQNTIKIILDNSINEIKFVQANKYNEDYTSTKDLEINFLNKNSFAFQLSFEYTTYIEYDDDNNSLENIVNQNQIAQYKIYIKLIDEWNKFYQKKLNNEIFEIDKNCEKIIFYSFTGNCDNNNFQGKKKFKKFVQMRNTLNSIRYQLTAVISNILPYQNSQSQKLLYDLYQEYENI
ncbi:hypothetical protein ABPG74_004565 [Tetrahymena malaccensis]